MSSAPLRLAVIVLSYNTRDLLRQCLASLVTARAAHAERLAIDLLVIDNASSDGSAQMVAAEFPTVQLTASPVNLGYTGGNNLGLALAGFPVRTIPAFAKPLSTPPPDFALLLNADTEVATDALWTMAHFLATTPEAGACGAHLRYGNGQFQHGAFAVPTLAQLSIDLWPLQGLPALHRLHNSRLNGRYPARQWQGNAPFAVDFVLGAAVMVRGAVIEQIGGLDDGYFMYCEELDWALRMKLAGWQVYAIPGARVTHHEGQSSKQVRWSAFVRLWHSRLRFFTKFQAHYPPGHRLAMRGLVWMGLQCRIHQLDRAFANGTINGVDWREERNAYRAVQQIMTTARSV